MVTIENKLVWDVIIVKMRTNKLIIISKEACVCVKHRCQLLRLRNIDDR